MCFSVLSLGSQGREGLSLFCPTASAVLIENPTLPDTFIGRATRKRAKRRKGQGMMEDSKKKKKEGEPGEWRGKEIEVGSETSGVTEESRNRKE